MDIKATVLDGVSKAYGIVAGSLTGINILDKTTSYLRETNYQPTLVTHHGTSLGLAPIAIATALGAAGVFYLTKHSVETSTDAIRDR